MPRSRRTGKAYAKGSQATWSPGDRRECKYCGGKLRITVDELQIHTNDVTGEHSSWHVECWRAATIPC